MTGCLQSQASQQGQNYGQKGKVFQAFGGILETFRPSDPVAGAGVLGKEEGGWGDRLRSPGSLSPCSQHMFPSLCISLLLVC